MAVKNRLPWSHNDILRLVRYPVLWRTALQAAFMRCYLYPRALPPVTHGSALQAPERLRGTGDVITLKGAYLGRTMRGQGFILVYRLAMDARTWRGDGGAD